VTVVVTFAVVVFCVRDYVVVLLVVVVFAGFVAAANLLSACDVAVDTACSAC